MGNLNFFGFWEMFSQSSLRREYSVAKKNIFRTLIWDFKPSHSYTVYFQIHHLVCASIFRMHCFPPKSYKLRKTVSRRFTSLLIYYDTYYLLWQIYTYWIINLISSYLNHFAINFWIVFCLSYFQISFSYSFLIFSVSQSRKYSSKSVSSFSLSCLVSQSVWNI